MIITETNNGIVIENLKKLVVYRMSITQYLKIIINKFKIDLVRLSKIVLGQVKLSEITTYEYYALCWGFNEYNSKHRNFFRKVDIEDIKVDIESKTIKNSFHVDRENILEIIPHKYYTLKLSIKEFNLLIANKIIILTDIIKDTLIPYEKRNEGVLKYGTKKSIDSIRLLISNGLYMSVPITVASVNDSLYLTKDGLDIAGEFSIIDGYHTFCALQGIEENNEFPVILNLIKVENIEEIQSIIKQMNNKNTIWKDTYKRKGGRK